MKIPSYPLNEKQKNEKKLLVEKLLKDPIILTWLKDNAVDEKIVENNSQLFADCLRDRGICEKCKELNSCKYNPIGYRKILIYDECLIQKLKACKYNNKPKQAHQNYFVHNDFPVEWLSREFKDMKITKDGNLFTVIKKIDDLLNSNDWRGIFLYGGLGVGKTHLMSCVANYCAKNKKKVGFYNMSTLSNQARMLISEPRELNELMENMMKCEVLILDDVGASKISEWIRDDWLYTVLNTRLEHQSRTFISSNLDYEGLKKYFSVKDGDDLKVIRLMERIEALTIPLQLEGENWRRKDGS